MTGPNAPTAHRLTPRPGTEPAIAPGPDKLDGHGTLMDGVYRHTRHIYDLSRKYYLLGRDRMICELNLRRAETVLEIGCGTGRNLVETARRYPGTKLFGVDASSEMLKTAAQKTSRAAAPITLVHGFAESVSLGDIPDAPQTGFDVVMFPYALSMIPDWEGAIANAASLLAPEGRFHAVDFGPMDRWPSVARAPFRKFLDAFHVEPRATIPDAMHTTGQLAEMSHTSIAGGYAELHFARRR